MKSIVDRIKRWSSWLTLVVFALLFVINSLLFLLQVPVARALGYAGQRGMFELDSRCEPLANRNRCAYDPSLADEVMTDLGESGRRAIVVTHLLFDFSYPFVYSILLAIALTLFRRQLPLPFAGWDWLPLLPFLGGLADLLENVGIITLALQYPHLSPVVAGAVNILTILKTGVIIVSLSLSLSFVVILIVGAAAQRLRKLGNG